MAEQTLFGYISEMDAVVGSIVDRLKTRKQHNNTVIVFSSDNGAPSGDADMTHPQGSPAKLYLARNFPYRGMKTELFEGGTRVAGIVYAPRARVDLLSSSVRGTTSDKLYHVTDWLPTLVALSAGNTTRNLPLDGHNIWPSLTDLAMPSPRSELLYGVSPICSAGQAHNPKAALRVGDMKLLTWCYSIRGINGSSVTGAVNAPAGSPTHKVDAGFVAGPVLYNLSRFVASIANQFLA
jgi:arylsulfatase A-like enzyme